MLTSPNTVRLLLSNTSLRGNLNRVKGVYAFGASTAREFENGAPELKRVLTRAPSGLRSLKEWAPELTKLLQASGRALVLPGPRGRAFDLSSVLEPERLHLFPIDLYETQSRCTSTSGEVLSMPIFADHRRHPTGDLRRLFRKPLRSSWFSFFERSH